MRIWDLSSEITAQIPDPRFSDPRFSDPRSQIPDPRFKELEELKKVKRVKRVKRILVAFSKFFIQFRLILLGIRTRTSPIQNPLQFQQNPPQLYEKALENATTTLLTL